MKKVEYRSRTIGDGRDIPFNKDIVRRSLKLNENIVISDADDIKNEDDKLTESLRIMNIRSVMCIPISTYSRTVGAIYVDALRRPYGFPKKDIALIREIGNRAAIFMDEKEILNYAS